MTWAINHTESSRYASLAEIALRENSLEKARNLYNLAAEKEIEALNFLDLSKQRTYGITVVSAISLFYKAHKFEKAEHLSHQFLSQNNLPAFAVHQLKDLLQTLKDEKTFQDSNVVSTKKLAIPQHAKRIYEVMYIVAPETPDEDVTKINENLRGVIEREGGNIVRLENMGRRKLAYEIKRKTEGHYVLFEIEGSGKEILELERRMRVNDDIMRYITVRVDEERKTAQKLRAKRESRRAARNSEFQSTRALEDEMLIDADSIKYIEFKE